jgi:preprotein translocase subunit SecF
VSTVAEAVGPKEPRHGPWTRLYRGETSFDFIGRRRIWFAISAFIIIIGIISLATRGLNLGIDFKGGTSWDVPSASLSVDQARNAVSPLGLGAATIEVLGSGSHRTVEVQYNIGNLSQAAKTAKINQVSAALARAGQVKASSVSYQDVGPTWGGDVTTKAIRALIVFLVAIALYITFRFEWRMALAALVAVAHDVLLTAGIYSLSGFQVTPDTVVAFLTVLGYSLYDTIVVFDRVRDNTRGLATTGRVTVSDTINLSMNQTLARSINTSLVAVLPILSVLVIGAQVLGATTLQDFGLALFIGLTSGAYSSIFIASPLLAMLKEREPKYANIRRRVESRGEPRTVLTPAAVAAGASGAAVALSDGGPAPGNGARGAAGRPDGRGAPRPAARRPGTPRSGARRPPPRPRKKGRRR